MITFNELLRLHGIDAEQVALLRHTGQRGSEGLTPYDLWVQADGSFDRYQRTQAPGERVFEQPIWASFASDPVNRTLFVGLYRASKSASERVSWRDPMTGLRPGEDKGKGSDLYDTELMPTLITERGRLVIGWDRGWVVWARYASKNNFRIVSDVSLSLIEAFEESEEGAEVWRVQKARERDPELALAALTSNASRHGGLYACEACAFTYGQRWMFDVHHPRPLAAGPRSTRASDLIVLCPTCHRRAHGRGSRFLPYSVEELREWNLTGRP